MSGDASQGLTGHCDLTTGIIHAPAATFKQLDEGSIFDDFPAPEGLDSGMKNELGTMQPLSARKLAANRANWAKWRGLTDAGRQRLRDAARRNRPWLQSTGPTTDAGKARSRANAVENGSSCATLEPFSTQTRLVKSILAYAHAYADCITQSGADDETINIPPEVAATLASAYCDFCDAHGFTLTENDVESHGVVFLGLALLDEAKADTGRKLGMIRAIIKADGIVQRAELKRALRRLRH